MWAWEIYQLEGFICRYVLQKTDLDKSFFQLREINERQLELAGRGSPKGQEKDIRFIAELFNDAET